MELALVDYGVRLENVPIMCNNKGTIDLSNNPFPHSRTKHIETYHHPLRDICSKRKYNNREGSFGR